MTETLSLVPANVQDLVDAIQTHGELTPSSARQLLADAPITVSDLDAWTDYGHPAANSYGRKLVFGGGFFKLMVMSWVDGDMAAIHDHGDMWGAVKLLGPAEHASFKVEDGKLRTADRRLLESGSVLAGDMIHQMGNVGQEPFLTLHLYGCYGRDGDVTGDARLYELDEGRIQRISGGAFFGLPESQVHRREGCPGADFPTLLRHQVELLKRLMTAGGSWNRGLRTEREKRLAEELFASGTWTRMIGEWEEMTANGGRRAERWTAVLQQEMRAAAALQERLLDAGFVEAPFSATRLKELLACEKLDDFADGYVGLLETAYDIAVPELMAA